MGVVVVTGHRGYLGSVLCGVLHDRGHVVHGVDSGLTPASVLGEVWRPPVELRADVRELPAEVLDGVDAVVHLAGLSNDPLGAIDPDLTDEVNHRATVRLARLARERGVRRLVFASSCSVYGASDGHLLDERSPAVPISAYARAKAAAERGILGLADDGFSPVVLRLATLHGPSPALRTDLVVNRLTVVGHHHHTVALDSDGRSWRPLLHVGDAAAVMAAVIGSPARLGGLVLNVVGRRSNLRMEDLARLVGSAVPDAVTVLDADRPPDPRSYRVSGRLLERVLHTRPVRTPGDGVAGVLDLLTRTGPSLDALLGPGHVRLAGLVERVGPADLDSGSWTRSIHA